MGYQAVYERWRDYCRRAGIQCSFYALRAAQVYEQMDHGVSGADLSSWLGVAPTTLRHYEHGWRANQARQFQYAIRTILPSALAPVRQGAEGASIHYDLGHGCCYCAAYLACPHRLACVQCVYYCASPFGEQDHQEGQQPMELTPEEYAGLFSSEAAWRSFCEGLQDVPTPAGSTPHQLAADPVSIAPTQLLVSRRMAHGRRALPEWRWKRTPDVLSAAASPIDPDRAREM